MRVVRATAWSEFAAVSAAPGQNAPLPLVTDAARAVGLRAGAAVAGRKGLSRGRARRILRGEMHDTRQRGPPVDDGTDAASEGGAAVPTLTLIEAAQRLGVTPRQVRRFVSQHKLRVRRESTTAHRHRRRQVLLDADEVDTLAQVRAYKRQQRAAAAPDQPASPSLAAATAQALHRVEKARADQARVAAQVTRLREKLRTAEQKLARRVARLAALQEGPAGAGGAPAPSAPEVRSAADPAETAGVYCVKCKGKRSLETSTAVVLKNGRPALKGPCAVCGTMLTCLQPGARGATERS